MSSKNFFKLQNSKNTVFNKERVEREKETKKIEKYLGGTLKLR
jgi:ribosomal protein S2